MQNEAVTQPEAEAIAETPNPIIDAPIEQAPEPAKVESAVKLTEKPSIRESLKAAEKKINADDKPVVETKEPVNAEKTAQVKDPVTGKFTPDPSKPVAVDPPSRFSPEAKADWANAPETVKAEVRRATTELEAGLKEYQARFEPLRKYEDIAKQAGTTIPAALDNYLNLERTLQSDPVAGLQRIFDYIGVNPREYAAMIMGQTPDVEASQQDHIIRDLKNEIANLKQEIASVTTTIHGQNQASIISKVDAFAAEHPRFDELHDTMMEMLQLQEIRGETMDLAKAYEMAERLNPAPFVPTIVETPKQDLSAQTARANKSITGSPSAGSYPATNGASSSIKDALRKAMLKAS